MRIFLDFDDTIYKTKDRIMDYMCSRGHKIQDGYNYGNIYDSLTKAYNVSEKEIEEMFSSNSFYLYLSEYFHEGATDTIIDLLDNGNEVFIATVGEAENNYHKETLMRKIDPRIKFLTKTFTRSEIADHADIFDKSMFNMSEGIHLDDNEYCIATSNAQYKYQFGRDVKNWNDFVRKIEDVIEVDSIEINGAIQYSDGRLATKDEIMGDFLRIIERAGLCFGGGMN